MKGIDTRKLLGAYIRAFNNMDDEFIAQAIPNAGAEEWLYERIPRVATPDADIERTYYFRWWTYRKHVKHTPAGYVVTEFLPEVRWAGKHNTIPCAVTHHVREGRWLRECGFLYDYIRFWYSDGGVHLHDYNNALEAAIGALADVRGDDTGYELLNDMASSFDSWKSEREGESGLYWSSDNRDGSEYSVSGAGFRPALNCYQYAGARAIAAIANRKGDAALADRYEAESARLYEKINRLLWNDELGFYVALPQNERFGRPYTSPARCARELFGYMPWAFGASQKGRSRAFRQMTDERGFAGKYGLTTVERRHPGYGLFYTAGELKRWLDLRGERLKNPLGHECLWNGPSWPFATSFALTAMANLLSGGEMQSDISNEDYVSLLRTYALSHARALPGGRVIPWIDENLNPDTGDWIARTRLMNWGGECFPASKGGYERGKDYNHSTFCDLVLEGLFGVRPGFDALRITPLFPQSWRYAILEDAAVHGRKLSVYYGAREGYAVYVNGKTAFHSPKPEPCALPWGAL